MNCLLCFNNVYLQGKSQNIYLVQCNLVHDNGFVSVLLHISKECGTPKKKGSKITIYILFCSRSRKKENAQAKCTTINRSVASIKLIKENVFPFIHLFIF